MTEQLPLPLGEWDQEVWWPGPLALEEAIGACYDMATLVSYRGYLDRLRGRSWISSREWARLACLCLRPMAGQVLR